jgi:hypothetical protein
MPAAASASVTLGQTCSPNATSQITAIQTATATGVPAASAPLTGVITSFSVLRHPTEAFQSRLKVLHENSAGSFTAVANGPLATLNPGLNVIPARVPIAAGDLIGTWGDPGTQRCNMVPLENRMESFAGPEPQPPETFSTNAFNGVIVDLSAQLEPDADRDIYGDETQDKCVGTTGSANGCPSTVTIDKLKQKGDTKVKVTATVPGAGTLGVGSPSDPALASAAAKKSLKAVTKTLTATTKQQLKLTLKLTKSAIGRLEDSGKLKLKLKAVYTPVGGPPGSQTKKAKLKS